MEKVADITSLEGDEADARENGEKPNALPAHYDFRSSYFAKPDR